MLIGVVVASAVAIAASTLVYAARVDAHTRSDLRADLAAVATELAWVNERGDRAEALAAELEACVTGNSTVLQPVVDASARFSVNAVARSAAVIDLAATYATSADEASVATVTEVVPSVATPAPDAGVDELNTALATAHGLRAEAGPDVELAELTARERDAACDASTLAVDVVLAEVSPRTETVIAGSGMASADAVAELHAARDAVLATSAEGAGAGALPRWLAAAGAVEESHRVANEAAIAAAEAARAAAERAAAERASAVSPGIVTRWPIEFPFPKLKIPTPDYDRLCETDRAWCELAPNYVPPAVYPYF
jgi:hypothetical protein